MKFFSKSIDGDSKNIKNYLFLSCFTFICFIMPGILFGLVNDFYTFRYETSFLIAFVLASFILPLVYPRFVSIIIFVLFALMEIIQFSHLFYYHSPLNVFALHLFFVDYKEVFDSIPMTLPWGLYHLFVVILTYFLLIFAYIKINRPNSYIALFVIIVLLSILPYKALFKTPRINNFMPGNNSVSLYNDLKVFTSYFFIFLKQNDKNIVEYKPYEINYTENGNKNIVLILGESVNANNIGLLGYTRDTTPLLKEFSKIDKNFIAQWAISSSVLTKVSIPMFMNISYNHNDIKHLLSQKTHLFKLAKDAGYKTFYFSNQTEAEAVSMSPNYIDVFYTKESYLLESNKNGDLVLLNKLNEYIDSFKNGKNFVIFHQRNPHSPYENSYKGRFDEAEVFEVNTKDLQNYRINSYDNALIFNDYIIFNIFNKFKNLSQNPTYVVFTPDHGEAIGELNENKEMEFGHAFLSKNVTNIPIFASAYNVPKNDKFLKQIKDCKYITHYEIALSIAKLMGYEIINPNFKDGIFYINGVDIAGNAGFIEIQRNKNDIKFIYN